MLHVIASLGPVINYNVAKPATRPGRDRHVQISSALLNCLLHCSELFWRWLLIDSIREDELKTSASPVTIIEDCSMESTSSCLTGCLYITSPSQFCSFHHENKSRAKRRTGQEFLESDHGQRNPGKSLAHY